MKTLTILSLVIAASCSAAASAGDAVHADSSAPPVGQPARASSTHDWTRFGWNAARSSASTDPTGIDSTNVATLRRQQVTIDGTVDASPIYLHGVQVNGAAHDVLIVTTTYGKTLAIDAGDGSVLWRFTPPGYADVSGSYRITTSTPVADPNRQFVYAAAPDGNVRKLAITDGHVVWSTAITALPQREKIASPLNYDRGHIIATTGGYIGDAPPYQGHVAVLDASAGTLLHVWNALCSDRAGLIAPSSCGESGSAIWGRAGAVVDSVTGDIFVVTGNGRWDGRTNWGDASIELDADATRLVGNYTPSNTETLNSTDADLGSTSPALIGGGVIVQGGKDGQMRLLQWSAMGGTTAHRGGEARMMSTPTGDRLFTAPAVLRAPSGTWLFASDGGGTTAWTLDGVTPRTAWSNRTAGTSPVVAGGLLYVYDPGGALHVYQPQTGREVARLDAGSGHWNSPIVVDGLVALPQGNANNHSTSGVLNIYRLP